MGTLFTAGSPLGMLCLEKGHTNYSAPFARALLSLAMHVQLGTLSVHSQPMPQYAFVLTHISRKGEQGREKEY